MAMNGNGRTHAYYAEAHAIAKQAKDSYGANLAAYGQIFLDPENGGEFCCEPGRLDVENGFCVGSSHMVVTGKLCDSGWVTTASSVLEGVNVRGVLTADRIEGNIFSTHPLQGYMPAIEFQEVKYTNLRIKGDVVTPQVDKAILGPTPKDAVGKDPNSDPYLDEWLTSDTFLGNVKNQDARIADNPRAPDFARARFRRKPGKCTVECALVSTIDNVPSQYRTAGHVIEVPGFGNVFVGELSVGRHFDLNMIRLELEDGIFTLGGPGVNGKSKP
jgi:hypothetical protein